jgi:PTS system mannose-specific IIA component
MIGIVVVTHGRLAEELVNAAKMIAGEIPAISAVSIGWSDDMAAATQAITRAIAEVGSSATLILTDMFGGTPTNLSLPFLSARVEIVTGVNLPMVIKALQSRDGTLAEAAARVHEKGRDSIYVASQLLGKQA